MAPNGVNHKTMRSFHGIERFHAGHAELPVMALAGPGTMRHSSTARARGWRWKIIYKVQHTTVD